MEEKGNDKKKIGPSQEVYMAHSFVVNGAPGEALRHF